MPSSMNLFSRRKNSDDKALRAALAPQVNPYLYSASASSAPALNSSTASSTVVQPPHSAPLPAHKARSLAKAHPIVSGFAAEGAGLVFAPHLSRARTLASDNLPLAREYGKAGMRKPLNKAEGSGFGRRTKSFDQRPPAEPYQEFTGVPPLGGPRCQSISPALQQGSSSRPEPLVSVNYSRAGSMRHRVPLSATGNSRHPSYSPASPHSGYPASPPLSPESPLVVEYGDSDISAHGMHYSSEVPPLQAQRGNHTDTDCLGLGVSGCDGENQQPSHLSYTKTIPMNETEAGREARSRELAALTFEFEPQAFEPARRPLPEDQKQLRQREFELVDAIKGKERELEFLRSNSHGYREQMAAMEQVLAQKNGELENARIRIHELGQNQIRKRNPSMTVGTSDMGVADMGRRLMEEIRRRERAEKLLAETISKAESNMQAVLIREEGKKAEIRAAVWREERIRNEAQQKSRDDLEIILGEEEKRRADLNWLFGEKIEKIEYLRRKDQEEFHRCMIELKEDKERLERQVKDNAQEIEQNRQSVRIQREANEELIEMTRKINTRLGEEKKKNRKLEEKINQITMDALNNVSGANREVVMLKNVIEDKDTNIKFFETELVAIKKEKKAMEEGCHDLEAELEEAHKTLLDTSERVKGLEQENMEVAEKLEAYQKELDERKQQADIAEKRAETPEGGDTTKIVELQDDIELYKKDVRVYRKDVKKRDNQIKDLRKSVAELESLLESKTLETNVLQDALDVLVGCRESSPSPNDSSGSESTTPFREEIVALKQKTRVYEKEYLAMCEDHEVLKKKYDLFVSQQAMIITEIDKQLARVRKEKDAVEAAATRQLKKMQHGFLQLSQTAVVGQLAGIGATAVAKNYQEGTLSSLPMKPGNPSSSKRSSSDLKRNGSKAATRRIQGSFSEERFRAELSPVAEPVEETEAVQLVGGKEDPTERAKLERGMSVTTDEPALGEEIFEW